MLKYLRKEVARSCPIHTAVADKAAAALADKGVFSKDAIIDTLNFGAIIDSIRWDYIREFIEEDQKCDLVPLAQTYFKRHPKVEERVNPERFLAMGHGKKTFGYAAVVPQNDHLVIARIEQRKAVANGVGRAFNEYVERLNAKRIENQISPVREEPMILEAPQEA
jgi:hypothetical protein